MRWCATNCTPNRNVHGPRTEKSPDAVTQFQTALPTLLTQQLEDRAPVRPVKVFAQDETRLGLRPSVRRRISARGVQPLATVTSQWENCYLYGAVELTTGARFFLEPPYLNRRAFQQWLDGFAAAFPESLNMLVLDNGAGHKAKAVRWPSNVVPVFLPPIVLSSTQSNGSGATSKTNSSTSRPRLSMRCQMPCAPLSNPTLPPLCNR